MVDQSWAQRRQVFRGSPWFTGLAVLTILLGLLTGITTWVRSQTLERAAQINVRWVAGVGEELRETLTERYLLTKPEQRDLADVNQNTWTYYLLDTSSENIQALVEDPAIDDTHHLDRGAFKVSETALWGDGDTWAVHQVRFLRRVPWLVWPTIPVLWISTLLACFVTFFGLGRIKGLARRFLVWTTVSARHIRDRLADFLRGTTSRSAQLAEACVFLKNRLDELLRPRVGTTRRSVQLAGIGVCFTLTFVVRWLVQEGLGGDDHWSLWAASALLSGDLPFRDFTDLGNPLHWTMSALAQLLFGYRTLGEIVLGITLMAAGVAVCFHLAWQASRSFGIAAIAILPVIALLTTPKLYSYPKVFLYPLALWFCWRYIDRPTTRRALMIALGVAVAFGYRIDHGAYVGLGTAAAVLLAHWGEGIRAITGALARYAAAVLLLLTPYLAVVQADEGVVEYFRERLRMAAQMDEGARRRVSFIVDRTVPLLSVGIAPPPSAKVRVDWPLNVTSGERTELERRYSLSPVGMGKLYDLTDSSLTNAGALLSDPNVASLQGLAGTFKRVYRVKEPLPSGAPVVIRWIDAVTDVRRAQLEQRYTLVNRRASSQESYWHYEMLDFSEEIVTALMSDRHLHSQSSDELIEPTTIPRQIWFVEFSESTQLKESGSLGPHVEVRWQDSVDTVQRIELEERYHLRGIDEIHTEYILGDTTESNVRALLQDLGVAHVRGLDPQTYRPNQEPRSAAIKRAVPLLRIKIASSVFHRGNAGPFLYYLVWALLAVTLLVLAMNWPGRASPSPQRRDALKILTTVVFVGVVNVALVRSLGYVSDHANIAGVLGAWLIARGLTRSARENIRSGESTLANGSVRPWAKIIGSGQPVLVVSLLVVTAAATIAYANPTQFLQKTGLEGGIRGMLKKKTAHFADLATSPPIDAYASVNENAIEKAVVRYLYTCTRPEDRLWLLSDLFAIPYQTERRFVRHVYWELGLRTSPEDQADVLTWLQGKSVPFIVAVGQRRPLEQLEKYDQLHEYASERYVPLTSIFRAQSPSVGTWLLVDRTRIPSGTHELLDLPCFR